MVNDWAVLLEFTICGAKIRFATDTVTIPGAIPVPDSDTA